ncbi:hypothetical protein Mapa_004036 [Marchantia paleacea]|nr:hypothetical protein Mapa_004036 [Marchantia paleacea]
MLTLGQLLIEPPKHLHDTESGSSYRIGEISSGGRHCAHNRHTSRPVGASEALDLSCALVEGGQTGCQIRRVPRIGRHFGQTAGNLTQSLGPSRGGVRHHAHIVPHVPEVLGQSDARVDRSLASGHGHVGGVGHESGPLHDGLLAAVGESHGQLREVHEHLRHLVPSLPAPDVHHTVRIRVLGQRLTDHSFPAPESSRDGASASQNGREERVQHSLPCEQGSVGRQFGG